MLKRTAIETSGEIVPDALKEAYYERTAGTVDGDAILTLWKRAGVAQ